MMIRTTMRLKIRMTLPKLQMSRVISLNSFLERARSTCSIFPLFTCTQGHPMLV